VASEAPPSFGALLRQHRLERALTQAALAERAELSERAIQHLERGLGQPHRETARRLAEALGLTGEEQGRFEAAALEAIPRLAPQVAVLDIDLGRGLSGIQLGLRLREQLPSLGIVLLSNHWVPRFLAALPPPLMAGWCYLLKKSVADVATLGRTIAGAAAGLVVLDPHVVAGREPKPGGALARLPRRQWRSPSC
jgi:transcriptional regulator with XRE-family HTH domain